jgi:hypothetical protein
MGFMTISHVSIEKLDQFDFEIVLYRLITDGLQFHFGTRLGFEKNIGNGFDKNTFACLVNATVCAEREIG